MSLPGSISSPPPRPPSKKGTSNKSLKSPKAIDKEKNPGGSSNNETEQSTPVTSGQSRRWRIASYIDAKGGQPVIEYITDKENDGDLALLIRGIQLLSQVGQSLLDTSMAKNLDGPIFELRSNRHRIMYAEDKSKNQFVLLSAFRKQTSKTPSEEIKKAQDYWDDYLRTGRYQVLKLPSEPEGEDTVTGYGVTSIDPNAQVQNPTHEADASSAQPVKRVVFLSGAWGGENEQIYQRMTRLLQDQRFEVVRGDQRSSYYEGISGKAFITALMERTDQMTVVVIAMNEQYLKSPAAMFEFVEIVKKKSVS